MGLADWDVAHSTAERAGVSIVALADLADAERTRDVIEAVWGDAQEIPRELIRALQLAGTVLLGGEADGELVGFVLGFPGISGGLHLHSHMLGVVPSWQARGVGYALKLAQRAACLDAGIAEIRWTYDPLVYRNARFNLAKLRARAIRFLPAFYGEMTDRLNRGDRSDRFEVSWRLSSDVVTRAIDRGASPREALGPVTDHDAGFDTCSGIDVVLRADGDPPVPRPARAQPPKAAQPPARWTGVAIPLDHHQLRSEDVALGRAWRDATAEAFRSCFARGLEATWITADGVYVFEPGAARE